MAARDFSRLQNAIVKGTDFDIKDLRNALMFDPESPESFSTFTMGFSTKKLDPTELFTIATLLALDVDDVYVRYVGLALRFGANPNTYINAKFAFNGKEMRVPVHIAKHIWDITPRNVDDVVEEDFSTYGDYKDYNHPNNTNNSDEDNTENAEDVVEVRLRTKQEASLDILCMMALKGLYSDAQITNAGLLTKMGVNATQFANQRPEFFGSVYGDIRLDDTLGERFTDEIKYFEQWKGSLQNAYGVNIDRDERILKYALLLDLPDVLSLTDVYGISENLKQMFFFQDNDSIDVILPRMKELGIIGVDPSTQYNPNRRRITRTVEIDKNSDTTVYDDTVGYAGVVGYADDATSEMKKMELILLDWSLVYYNYKAIDLLMKLGVVPDYAIRSQTIKTAKNKCRKFPLQCKIMNTILISYVREGYGLDTEQLHELSFSPSTVNAIKKEYATPSWKYMCKVKSGDINPDMKELAREVNIPLGSSKEQICDTFEAMSKGNPSTLKETSYRINRDRIEVMSTSAADIASGRKILSGPRTLPAAGSMTVDELQQQAANGSYKLGSGSASGKTILRPEGSAPPAPICSNSDTLTKPIEEYPDIDRVTYSDGKSTWCFTSVDFPQLIETKRNPWAMSNNTPGSMGDQIPDAIIIEMQQKLDLIEREGLDPKPGSISRGIDKLFDSNPVASQATYERETLRRMEQFYAFVESYGIPRERFASLNSSDFQLLSDSVLSPSTRIVVDPNNPRLALRDFADSTLVEMVNFQNRDRIGQTLASILMQ